MEERDKYIPKPCPFCNMNCDGITFLESPDGVFSMRCEFCDSTGPIATDKDDSILKWNRRAK
jgi:hypothetical protein